MDSTILLSWSKVGRVYERQSEKIVGLSPTSLEIRSGELIGIRGPSGSGKTTLLQLLGFVDVPTSGEIVFRDRVVSYERQTDLRKLRASEIGFVFQYFNLMPGLTAHENVCLTMLMSGVPRREAEPRASLLLESVGLRARAEHYPAELSGGEMQRVAVCRALAHKPSLLIADEPTGNLDSVNGRIVVDLLIEAHGQGMTCVIASHNDEVLARCPRLLQLRDGIVTSVV